MTILLYFLNLFQKTRVAILISSRLGHLVLNTEAYFRTRDKSIKVILLAPLPVVNGFLLQKWGECLENTQIIQSGNIFYPILSRLIYSLAEFNSRYIVELPFQSENDSDFWLSSKPCFYFNQKEKEKGEKILESVGIGRDDWYVCVFARDSAYLDQELSHYGKKKIDWRYHDYRDSDIDTLNLAIQEIIDRGGWVIRLGKIVAKKMSFKHPKVIDYPFVEWRSDFMDIYLQYHAKFILSSSTSGATDVVVLFNTPYCGVNMPFNWRGGYVDTIQIPKKYKKNGRYLSLHEWIEISKNDKTYLHSDFYVHHNLEIINNSPEEILQITKEMFDRLDGKFNETSEDRERQELYDRLYQQYTPFEKCKSPIGRQFLRDNSWYLE